MLHLCNKKDVCRLSVYSSWQIWILYKEDAPPPTHWHTVTITDITDLQERGEIIIIIIAFFPGDGKGFSVVNKTRS